MTDGLEAIRQTFFQECEEQLAELESGLVAIEEGTADQDTVNAVFRSVHSIKGGAGAFQLTDLVAFAHGFETVLDGLRTGRLTPDPEVLRVMLRASDTLADLVRAARDEAASGTDWKDLLAELDLTAKAHSGDHSADEAAAEDEGFEGLGFVPVAIQIAFDPPDDAPGGDLLISFRPRRSLFANANDPLPILRELTGLGSAAVSCDQSRLPLLDALDPEEGYLAWDIVLQGATEAAVREYFEFVEEDCVLEVTPSGQLAMGAPAASTEAGRAWTAPQPTSSPPAESASAEEAALPAEAAASKASVGDHAPSPTIRVDLDRVDRLINLVGELVINQAMLMQRVNEAGVAGRPAVSTGLDELKHLTREIQEGVMAIRAQPVKPLFQRMGRIVREVAAATGKTVRLKTEGEATEVDKTVVERLADPLTHLIRNAIDHGVETPERRLAANKPVEGTVRLIAAHRSGRVVIEVSDDGAGIDRARVRQTAERKGLIAPDMPLSDGEIDNLLFLPGFSTAETVSDISGRGVGMDVVKRSIQSLGGRLAVSSRPGGGSSFVMSLPLTLAVLDGMVVSVAGQTLVVPLTAIMETLRPQADDIHRLGAGARVLAIRGGFVPLIEVGAELGFVPSASWPDDVDDRRVVVLVETSEGSRSALLVDAIQDQRQVVIKSLEANYGHVPGIAAATILGDGRVALILDVDSLLAGRGDATPPRTPPSSDALMPAGSNT